jgi:hypothetical protein
MLLSCTLVETSTLCDCVQIQQSLKETIKTTACAYELSLLPTHEKSCRAQSKRGRLQGGLRAGGAAM